jgi:hypothetical protein
MSRNYSSTIVAVIVVLFKFSGIRNGMFFDGWRAYGKIPSSGSKQWCIASAVAKFADPLANLLVSIQTANDT